MKIIPPKIAETKLKQNFRQYRFLNREFLYLISTWFENIIWAQFDNFNMEVQDLKVGLWDLGLHITWLPHVALNMLKSWRPFFPF